MMRSKNWMRTTLGAAAGAYALALPAWGSFMDDFTDGDPQDHQPAYWQPIGDLGDFEVVGPDYVLTPHYAGIQISARGETHLIGPVRVTTQVRLTESAEYAGVWARGAPNPSVLWAAVINDGSLQASTQATAPAQVNPLEQDVMLELLIYDETFEREQRDRETGQLITVEFPGHVLKARAWPLGEERPAEPLIVLDGSDNGRLIFSNNLPGSVGIFTRSTSGSGGSAIFRWIEALTLGDMDGNDVLDAFDVAGFEAALADPAAFAASQPGIDPHIMGDLNGDGACDAFDITPFELGLALAGGSTTSAAVIPEPATLALLGLGGLMLLRKRR